jgi:hypothetical protein
VTRDAKGFAINRISPIASDLKDVEGAGPPAPSVCRYRVERQVLRERRYEVTFVETLAVLLFESGMKVKGGMEGAGMPAPSAMSLPGERHASKH